MSALTCASLIADWQEAIACPERGLLLLRCRDQFRMTLAAYGAVAHGGVEYGIGARGRVAASASYVDPSTSMEDAADWRPDTSESKGLEDLTTETALPGGARSMAGVVGCTLPATGVLSAGSALSAAAGQRSRIPPAGANVPFAPADGRVSAEGGASSLEAVAGPAETPFAEDDEPRAAARPAESDDAATQAAVRRLAAEVRGLQLQTQERRMLARVLQLAASDAAARVEQARAVEADELRTQNALLAAVVAQAMAAREDLLGGADVRDAEPALVGGDAEVSASYAAPSEAGAV